MSATQKRQVRQQVAGSGKTYWLVREYVSIMLDGDQTLGPANIPVITFTEAAGRELIDRVRDELQRVAGGIRSPFGESERPSSAGEKQRAEQVLADLGAAPIGTIHSFARRLLLQTAVHAGVPFGVEVRDAVDPITEDAMVSRVRTLYRRHLASQPVPEDVLVRDSSSGKSKYLLEDAAALLGLVPAALLRSPGHAALGVADTETLLGGSWTDLQEASAATPDLLTVGELASLMDEVLDTLGRLRDVASTAAVVNACEDRVAEAQRLVSVFGARDADEVGPVKVIGYEGSSRMRDWFTVPMKKTGDRFGIDTDIPALGRLAAHEEAAERRRAESRRAYARTAGALALHAHIGVRSESGDDWLLQDEMLQRALLVVLRDQDAREALRHRYPTILLDEAQDIDATQRELLLTLTDGLGMTVVGDPQQSIYGFRGADHGTFATLAERVVADHRTAAEDQTRRCLPLIVSTVNALFDGDDSAREQHTPMRGLRGAIGRGGSVTALVPRPEAVPNPEEPGKELKPQADDYRAAQAEAIAEQVAKVLGSGEAAAFHVEKDSPAGGTDPEAGTDPGEAGWSPPSPADIAILVHSRKAVPTIEQALRSRGIAANVRTSADIARHPMAEGLAACLLAVSRTDDTRSLLVALRSPVFGCTDADLTRHWLTAGGPRLRPVTPTDPDAGTATEAGTATPTDPRTAADSGAATLRSALALLWRSRQILLTSGPAAALDLIMRQQYVGAVLAAADPAQRAEAWSQIRLLAEQVADRQSSTVEAPHQFALWLTDQIAAAGTTNGTVLDEPDAEAVTITTIHQAKGLQWPIVVVAAPGGETSGGKSLDLVGEDVQVRITKEHTNVPDTDGDPVPPEIHRLFYVALTRARDHLVISAVAEATNRPHLRLLGSDHVETALQGVAADPEVWQLDGQQIEALRVEPVPVRVGHRPATVAVRPASGGRVGPGDVEARLAAIRRSAARTVRREQPSARGSAAEPGSAPAPGVRPAGGPVRWASGTAANTTGEFVHKVLEHVDMGAFTDLGVPLADATDSAKLRAADELGDHGVDRAIAERMLISARGSGLLARAAAAPLLRRELPISGNRTEADVLVVVNGIIDLLFAEDSPESAAGSRRRWVLVDYKTDSTEKNDADFVAGYRSQLSAYADLLALVGIDVDEQWLVRITPEGVRDLRVV